LVRFLPVFVPFFALFPSMPCAYLYVHNFPRTRVSRFGRENLAFDKETAEATRNALSGRGLAAPAKRLAKMTKFTRQWRVRMTKGTWAKIRIGRPEIVCPRESPKL
jgi:hypothetical protein